MSGLLDFSAIVDQNEYLPDEGSEVHALVTVEAKRSSLAIGNSVAPAAAEVILIDCSGSMETPPDKLERAKEAAAAAIDELRDGVLFGVVAGTTTARMVWPRESKLVAANAWSRSDAKVRLQSLTASGGTAMGQWLLQARSLLAEHPGAIKHAVLLTDGKNEHETPEQLAKVLTACEPEFNCDCRGVGTAWDVPEMRGIATTLGGNLRMVADPADLADDFRSMMSAAMARAVHDVRLRLWTPQGAVVRVVKQVSPEIQDLTGRRITCGPLTADYATGSWGVETRDYHLVIEVSPGTVGDQMLAGRVTVVTRLPDGSEDLQAEGLVRAAWTDDLQKWTWVPESLKHYTGQEELAQLLQDGALALRDGDDELAVEMLSKGREIAEERGLQDKVNQIDKIIEYDPDTGTFTLNSDWCREDEMRMDAESSTTAPFTATEEEDRSCGGPFEEGSGLEQ